MALNSKTEETAHPSIASQKDSVHLGVPAEERSRLMEQLATISETLNRSLTTEEVAEAIGKGALKLTRADRGALYRRGTKGELIRAWTSQLSTTHLEQLVSTVSELEQCILKDALSILSEDTRLIPPEMILRELAIAEGIRAVALWPLVYGGQVVAAVGCYYDQPHQWTQTEREVAEIFSRQAALALQSAYLFDETSRRANELEWLAEISASLRAAPTPEEMQSIVTNSLMTLLDCSGITLSLHDGTTGETNFSQTRGDWREAPGMESPSHVSVPLRVDHLTIGSIWVTRPLPFSDSEMRLMMAVADIAANAIHRAQVVETLEQRVKERTQKLAQANERLTELDRLKSKFVSDVSHELRTPIQNLKMYLDLLERGKPEKRGHYLSVLKEQASRLQQLTEDILDLSLLELRVGRGEFQRVNLNDLVSQVIEVLAPGITDAHLVLSLDLDPSAPSVWGDRNQLAQVVTNLLANAVNYTPSGQIVVSTRAVGYEVCLTVRDTGIGIADVDIPHLFERFYRSSQASQTTIRGTGLGLAIVKEIIDLHNGRIDVESRVGAGSLFSVWLLLATTQD
jgi:signal transduction histidine kinase